MSTVKLHRSMLTLTNRCTLNCLYCSAYVPLYHHPPHYTFTQLESYTNRYFELIDYVDIFTLTGGEPLLHENIDKVIFLFDKYYYRVGKLCLITNGTIVPNELLLEAIIKYRGEIYVLLDDYGAISVNCDKVEQVLKETGIVYERRKYYGDQSYCNGWVDNWNLAQKFFSLEDVEENHHSCETAKNNNLCMIIKGGVIYPCGPVFKCISDGIVIDDDNPEHLDLMNPVVNRESFFAWAQKMYQATSFRSCAYCSGVNSNSQRYMPAQQIVKNNYNYDNDLYTSL